MKRNNTVSLTVHRNTLAKRRARGNAKIMAGLAERERQQGDVEGFIVIAWSGNKAYSCDIHAPETSPVQLSEIRSFVDSAIIRELAAIDRQN